MSTSRLNIFALSVISLLAPLGGAVAQTDKPWIIGEVAPLTGPVATVGTRLNKAVKMWADDVNAKGASTVERSIFALATTKIGLTRPWPVRGT